MPSIEEIVDALKKSMKEIVDNLNNNIENGCLLNHIEGNEEYEYMIAYEPNKKEIIGIMKTISKLNVSEKRWQEIWADS